MFFFLVESCLKSGTRCCGTAYFGLDQHPDPTFIKLLLVTKLAVCLLISSPLSVSLIPDEISSFWKFQTFI
jgi:hypothetical protein